MSIAVNADARVKGVAPACASLIVPVIAPVPCAAAKPADAHSHIRDNAMTRQTRRFEKIYRNTKISISLQPLQRPGLPDAGESQSVTALDRLVRALPLDRRSAARYPLRAYIRRRCRTTRGRARATPRLPRRERPRPRPA